MNKRLQLVLPSKLVPVVLEGLHSSLVGGHMGAKKTLDKVRCRFYWAGQRKDIIKWCVSCPSCCSRKAPIPAPSAPMQLDNTFLLPHSIETTAHFVKSFLNPHVPSYQ